MDVQQLGRRLREARERAAFTQAEAAGRIGVTPSALSQYESGKRGIDALMLERFSHLYAVPVTFFFAQTATVEHTWENNLRQKASTLSAEGKQGISLLINDIRSFAWLHEITDTPVSARHATFHPLPDHQVFSDDEVADFADDARRYFDLGIAPISDMDEFLELHGDVVFAVPLGPAPDDLSGLYFCHPEVGPVIAVNEDQSLTRRPFTLAHELAHSLFHHDQQVILCRGQERHPIERFADRFASYFLIPPQTLAKRWRELEARQLPLPERIIHLAQHFKVSFSAMNHRLKNDGLIRNAPELATVQPMKLARTLGYPISPAELGRRPLPPERRVPRMFLELVHRAIENDRISVQRGAELLRISDIEMEELLEPPMSHEDFVFTQRYG